MKMNKSTKLITITLLGLLFFLSSKELKSLDAKTNGLFNCKIEKIVPNKYEVGDTITIYGKNFGAERADNIVVFKGNDVAEDGYAEIEDKFYLEWQDNEIKVVVPKGVTSGKVLIMSRKSNELSFEVVQTWFVYLIDLFVKLSLGITVVFIYLQINKIWKRKHELEVANSQSLTGLFIFVMNCFLWVIYYIFVEEDINSTIDTAIYIFQGSIFFLIGTGVFVRGQKRESLWILIKRALKLERKEADYLLKKWFKPQNAEAILNILHQIAMIDEEFDPKEQELILAFAKEWNIDYDWDKLEKYRNAKKDNTYMKLRQSLVDYLTNEPPHEQVAQLKDMITTMIEADDKVTKEEEMISSELLPMIENYLAANKNIHEYRVLIVPQKPDQEITIKELIPTAEKIEASGGTAFSVGSYYSQKFAEMMCEQYRKVKFFTIVNNPDDSKNKN